MDMNEASAMTEASGLTDDLGGPANSLGNVPGTKRIAAAPSVARLSEQLQKMTVEAPLRSLFLAFMLGVWIARRR
jgi:hypothetical protein